MRKLFLLPFLAMACVFMSGCTSDYEFEDGQSAKEQKALEVKVKIQELAEDYGLNAQIGGEIQPEEVDSIDLNKVEAVFKAIASSMGRYRLECEKLDDGKMKIKQISLNSKPKRKLTRKIEEVESFSCNFADETGITEKLVGADDFIFICSCSASWSAVNDMVTSATVSPRVELKQFGVKTYRYEVFSRECNWHNAGGNGFAFEGDIDIDVYVYKYNPVSIRISYAGSCWPDGGSIFWYPQA